MQCFILIFNIFFLENLILIWNLSCINIVWWMELNEGTGDGPWRPLLSRYWQLWNNYLRVSKWSILCTCVKLQKKYRSQKPFEIKHKIGRLTYSLHCSTWDSYHSCIKRMKGLFLFILTTFAWMFMNITNNLPSSPTHVMSGWSVIITVLYCDKFCTSFMLISVHVDLPC